MCGLLRRSQCAALERKAYLLKFDTSAAASASCGRALFIGTFVANFCFLAARSGRGRTANGMTPLVDARCRQHYVHWAPSSSIPIDCITPSLDHNIPSSYPLALFHSQTLSTARPKRRTTWNKCVKQTNKQAKNKQTNKYCK